MDSVLYKIIEIERTAQNISEDAEKAKRNLPNEIDAEKEKRSIEIEKQTDLKIQKLAEDEASDEASKIEQMEQQQKKQLAALRELFAKNSSAWENEIYEIIRKK